MDTDGKQLGRHFEECLMKRRINQLTDVDDLKLVANNLVELNFLLQDQLKRWAAEDPEKALELL